MVLILKILFLLPATFLHELSHLIACVLTFSKPYGFSLIPKIKGNTIILGSVRAVAYFDAAYFFIGLAPISLFFLAIYIIYNNIVIINKYITYIIVYYLIIGSKPSKQDIKVAISGLFSISGLVFVITILFLLKKYLQA